MIHFSILTLKYLAMPLRSFVTELHDVGIKVSYRTIAYEKGACTTFELD
ncbi:MAG: hypothetical protein HRT83_03560 [Hyphomicrobiaceae bacterium]|nr:hypothetical protein [Hyphomicrobiaceae bacterium]